MRFHYSDLYRNTSQSENKTNEATDAQKKEAKRINEGYKGIFTRVINSNFKPKGVDVNESKIDTIKQKQRSKMVS